MTPLLKFLIVDDVPENRSLVSKALLKKFAGSLVLECEESTPAIAAAQHDRLSAVIVHRGRDVDGPTIVALVRRVNPGVPIVMVSGRASCPAAIEAGANAFLNYDAWQRIGMVVEETLAAEKGRARASKFPFVSVAGAAPRADAAGSSPAAAGAPAATVPRILYVEDDQNDVDLLRETLAVEGIAAEIVHISAPDQLSAVMKHPAPSLILADGKVAGFPTTAALQFARAWCPQVPFFCLTGLITDEKIATMRAAGAAGCLSKRDLSAVSATIRRTLAPV